MIKFRTMKSQAKPLKCVNPCLAKGRSGGSRFGGVIYKIKDHIIRVGGCECAQPFLNLGLRTEKTTRYAIADENSETPGMLLSLKNPSRSFPKKSFTVVSCEERFRHANSEGTKFFSNIMGTLTSFQGCQKLEEELLAQKLVRHRPPKQEVLGWSEKVSREELLENTSAIPNGDEFMAKHFVNRVQFDATHESSEEIITHAKNREKWTLYVQAGMEDFELTYKQKSAFNLLFPIDGEGLTYPEAAKKLRISVYSLKSRMKGIRKKLEERFPEFKRGKQKTKIKGLYRANDRQNDGFFYRSGARKIALLYRIDPVTGEKSEIQLDKTPHKASKTKVRGLIEARQWYHRTTYYPAHNGTWAAWIRILKPTDKKSIGGGFDQRSALKHLNEIRILELWEKQDLLGS